jgi:hypothetical protein
MAPKTANVKLSELAVSEDELSKVRDVIAKMDRNKLASTKASLKHFLKTNPGDHESDKTRTQPATIERFMAHMMKCKDTDKNLATEKAKTTENTKFTDLFWWNVEQCDMNLGATRSEHWRESKLLPTQPDSLTGSTLPQHIEYGVPKTWQRISVADLHSLKLMSNKHDADDEDQASLDSLMHSGAAAATETSSSSAVDGGNIAIKVEESLEMKKLSARIDALKNNTDAKLREYQDKLLTIQKVYAKSDKDDNEFANSLTGYCKKTASKLEPIVKTLKKMAVEAPVEGALPKVIAKMDTADVAYDDTMGWAIKFGYSEKEKQRNKRVKREAA